MFILRTIPQQIPFDNNINTSNTFYKVSLNLITSLLKTFIYGKLGWIRFN